MPQGYLAVAGLLVAISLCGCPVAEPTDDPEPVMLARTSDWARVVDPSIDAFADLRPDGTICNELMGLGIDPVGFAFEVKTDFCDYATLRQSTLVPLVAGDVVHVRVWHDELVAPAPSTGYVGFAIRGEVSWSGTHPIPHPVGTLEGDVVLDEDLPVGSELQFHVHNHGINSWNLLDVMATPGEAP